MNLPQVEASVVDLSKFATVVKLVAFYPFQSGVNALDNINAISEGYFTIFFEKKRKKQRFFLGLVHDDLRTFLDTNLPKEKKRAKMTLGVADPRIASTINEFFSISCQHTGVIPELLRGKIYKRKNLII
jgi:nucleolar protein 56